MGLVYLYVAGEQLFKGGHGQAIMFFGYALGNLGLLFVVK